MRLALALAAAAACGGAPAPARPLGPPLEAALAALDGGALRLSELRGQVVVVHVFTTWSVAAELERDALVAADARPDVTVIGLAFDPEGYPMIAPWRAATAVPYLIAVADDATRAGRGPFGRVTQIPTTIVLDRAGRVSDRLDHQLSPAQLAAAIARAE